MKEQKNDDQLLLRLPSEMKSRMETAAKVEGMTTQEWIRDALQSRLCLENVCPKCSLVNAGKAKFCSECGTSLAESKRAIYREWVREMIREEFGEGGCPEGAASAEQIFDSRLRVGDEVDDLR